MSLISVSYEEPAEASHGLDTDANGVGRINGQRLYQLIRRAETKDNQEAVFEIEFLQPRAEVYAFTFG